MQRFRLWGGGLYRDYRIMILHYGIRASSLMVLVIRDSTTFIFGSSWSID